MMYVFTFAHARLQINSFLLALVLNVARLALNLLYFFTQQRIFLVFQRLFVFLNLLLGSREHNIQFLPLLLSDIVAYTAFVLSIDQRNYNFDSRLFLDKALVK